jgi:hypothetical protein
MEHAGSFQRTRRRGVIVSACRSWLDVTMIKKRGRTS